MKPNVEKKVGISEQYLILMIEEQRILLSQQDIQNSPSIQSGMSENEEFLYRCFACELVREGQILLGLFYVFWTVIVVDHLLLVLLARLFAIGSIIFIHLSSSTPSLVSISCFH